MHLGSGLSRQIYVVPDLCCIVTQRSVKSVGQYFIPLPVKKLLYLSICYGHATRLVWMQQSLGVTG